MDAMFRGMSGLTSLDLSSFETSNVKYMGGMFYINGKLTMIIYGNNFIRQSDADISFMFYYCPANRPTHESWNGAFD